VEGEEQGEKIKIFKNKSGGGSQLLERGMEE